jgi:hypothetical protein
LLEPELFYLFLSLPPLTESNLTNCVIFLKTNEQRTTLVLSLLEMNLSTKMTKMTTKMTFNNRDKNFSNSKNKGLYQNTTTHLQTTAPRFKKLVTARVLVSKKTPAMMLASKAMRLKEKKDNRRKFFTRHATLDRVRTFLQ